MLNKKYLISGALLCLGILAAAGPARARGNISLGSVQVNPYLNLRQQYRSNIYLTADDEISDFITFLSPGVRFYMPRADGEFELDYRADLLFYRDNSREDTDRHLVLLKGDWIIGRNYDFVIQNRLHITDDPATSELTELEDRTRNTFNTGLTRTGNNVSLGAGFTSVLDDYKDRDDLDRTENYITLDGYYTVRPKTDIHMRYRRGEIKYDRKTPLRDASYDELTAGVTGRISPKITGEIRAGYQWRDYDDPARQDFGGGVVVARAVHQMNTRVRTTLDIARGAEESTFGDNSYYAYTSFNLGYEHIMGRKHVARAGAGYRNNDYPEAVGGFSREDDIWSFSLGWDYNIRKWAVLGISYEHRKRDSDYPLHDYDYIDNRVSIHCSLSF